MCGAPTSIPKCTFSAFVFDLCYFSLLAHTEIVLSILKGLCLCSFPCIASSMVTSKTEHEGKILGHRPIKPSKLQYSVFPLFKSAILLNKSGEREGTHVIFFLPNISPKMRGPWNTLYYPLQDGWGLGLARYRLCVLFRPVTHNTAVRRGIPWMRATGYFFADAVSSADCCKYLSLHSSPPSSLPVFELRCNPLAILALSLPLSSLTTQEISAVRWHWRATYVELPVTKRSLE